MGNGEQMIEACAEAQGGLGLSAFFSLEGRSTRSATPRLCYLAGRPDCLSSNTRCRRRLGETLVRTKATRHAGDKINISTLIETCSNDAAPRRYGKAMTLTCFQLTQVWRQIRNVPFDDLAIPLDVISHHGIALLASWADN
jgi:hypothetical protein